MNQITIVSTNPDNGQERIDTIENDPKRIAKHIKILKNRNQLNIKVIK